MYHTGIVYLHGNKYRNMFKYIFPKRPEVKEIETFVEASLGSVDLIFFQIIINGRKIMQTWGVGLLNRDKYRKNL